MAISQDPNILKNYKEIRLRNTKENKGEREREEQDAAVSNPTAKILDYHGYQWGTRSFSVRGLPSLHTIGTCIRLSIGPFRIRISFLCWMQCEFTVSSISYMDTYTHKFHSMRHLAPLPSFEFRSIRIFLTSGWATRNKRGKYISVLAILFILFIFSSVWSNFGSKDSS